MIILQKKVFLIDYKISLIVFYHGLILKLLILLFVCESQCSATSTSFEQILFLITTNLLK